MSAAPLRVLVCGGRDYEDGLTIHRILSAIRAEAGIALIIEGGASGADRLASRWAEHHGVPFARMPAHWTKLGKAAGPVRNGWMIDLLNPDLGVAFPGGTGTAGCVKLMRAAGIPVREIAATPTPSPQDAP